MDEMDSRSWIIGVLALVLVGAGYFAWGYWSIKHEMTRAHAALEKGLPAVAVDRLEKIKNSLISRPDGCSLLINAYFAAKRPEQLQWASEACIDTGVEGPESYVGLAASYEARGYDRDAVRVLNVGIKKYSDNPNLFLR